MILTPTNKALITGALVKSFHPAGQFYDLELERWGLGKAVQQVTQLATAVLQFPFIVCLFSDHESIFSAVDFLCYRMTFFPISLVQISFRHTGVVDFHDAACESTAASNEGV